MTMDLFTKNLLLQFHCKIQNDERTPCLHKDFVSSDGDEDEDDEGISERSLRRSPSDDGN